MSPANSGATWRPALIAGDMEGVGEAVEAQRARERDDMAAIDQPPSEPALRLR